MFAAAHCCAGEAGGTEIGLCHTDEREGINGARIVDACVLVDWLEAQVCTRLSELDRKLAHIQQSLDWGPQAADASDAVLQEHPNYGMRARPDSDRQFGQSSATPSGDPAPTSRMGAVSSSASEAMEVGATKSSIARAQFAKRGQLGSMDSAGRGSSSAIIAIPSQLQDMSEERRSSFIGLQSRLMARKKYSKSIGDWIWKFLDDPESGKWASYYEKFLTTFITMTVVTALFQTWFFTGITAEATDFVIEGLFVVELAFRFGACPAKLAFLATTGTVLDFLSVTPLVLRVYCHNNVELTSGTIVTGVLLGIVPVLRMLKLLRHFQKLHLLMKAFQLALEALPAMIFLYVFLLLLFTVMLFLVEPRWNVPTLPSSMWLTFVSMTTVGYGDMTPDTTVGRCVIGLLTVISMLYVAIPLGIIGNAFSEVWRERDRILLTRRFRGRLLQWGYRGKDLPKLFQIFDRDGDGELNLSEFKRMMRDMGLGMTGTRILQLFELFDGDGSGAVDDREFVKGLFPEEYSIIYAQCEDDDGETDFDLTQRLALVEAEILAEHSTDEQVVQNQSEAPGISPSLPPGS